MLCSSPEVPNGSTTLCDDNSSSVGLYLCGKEEARKAFLTLLLIRICTHSYNKQIKLIWSE